MNIDDIRNNAPEGATHYDIEDGEVRYFKKKSNRQKFIEIYNSGKWYGAFAAMSNIVKPL